MPPPRLEPRSLHPHWIDPRSAPCGGDSILAEAANAVSGLRDLAATAGAFSATPNAALNLDLADVQAFWESRPPEHDKELYGKLSG